MLVQPYRVEELQFAYCYRVYLRWRTHRAKRFAALAELNHSILESLAGRFHIRVLECTSDATDLLALISLRPVETISGCASKLKGQVSKWLRQALHLQTPTDVLGRGYFACTVGKSTREEVLRYLSSQPVHHGYSSRPVPPGLVESYRLSRDDEVRIAPRHASVVSQFHLVMATSWRKGVFGVEIARAVADRWLRLQSELRMALVKVSFLPDHVHIALRAHPDTSPAGIVVALMNDAQQVVFNQSASTVVKADIDRLWQPSAYIGGYGDLSSPQIRRYIQRWKDDVGDVATNLKLDGSSPVHMEFT